LLGFAAIILVMAVLERVSQQHLRRNQQPPRHSMPTSRRVGWLLLGASPGIAWHLWHGWWRGLDALVMWGGQGLSRVTTVVEGNQGSWLVPITEVLEGGWPWLLLLPAGFGWAWHHRHERAGLWELGLLVGSAALVLPLRTQLPWYSHLLWPAIALLCGEGLSQLLVSGKPRWVPSIWTGLGACLLLAGSMAWLKITDAFPPAPFLWAGGGLLLGGFLLRAATHSRRSRGLALLLIGWSLALLSLWQSRFWLWELNEAWDPRPIAAVIRTVPDEDPVYLQGPTRRRQSERPTERHWLITRKSPASCKQQTMSLDGDWQLWLCPETTESTQEQNGRIAR
jgi:4-amino-4-deoxy-L-arabinose transferase-like glycosyltransferase